MSIYFAMKYADEIQILSDGASWDDSGCMVKVVSKVHSSKVLPLIVAGRGDVQMIDACAASFISSADEAGSVDEAVDALANVLPQIRENIESTINQQEAHFSLLIAGVSEARGLFMSSFITFGADAYQFRDMNVCIGSPPLGPEVGRRFQTGVRMEDPRFFRNRGVELMDVVRMIPPPDQMPWGGEVKIRGAMAGGMCELVTVCKTGVSRRILKDYADPIGQPINPFRQCGNVTPIGNRKERRAAKRRAA